MAPSPAQPGCRVREEGLALSRCPRHARRGISAGPPVLQSIQCSLPTGPPENHTNGSYREDSGPGLMQPETCGKQSHMGNILGSHTETHSKTGPKGMQRTNNLRQSLCKAPQGFTSNLRLGSIQRVFLQDHTDFLLFFFFSSHLILFYFIF